MRKILLASLGAAGCLAVAAPSQALTPISACAVTDVGTPGAYAQACSGYYAGNLLKEESQALLDQQAALDELDLVWNTADWGAVDAGKDTNKNALVEFSDMSGLTWIGIHYGAGQGGPGVGVQGGVTAFYLLDAGTGMDSFAINRSAISDLTLYKTGGTPTVPEPASWAMLLLGFGLIGTSLRRNGRKPARVAA